MTAPVRIQRQRTKGWRMPEGAIYVGRPTIFGNPWTMRDAADRGLSGAQAREWLVEMYRSELDHLGLLSDYSANAPAAYERLADLIDWPDVDEPTPSIRPLFRHLLRDATALACWCPLVDAAGQPFPCHADVLLELLAEGSR